MAERGNCAECGGNYHLLANGTVRGHNGHWQRGADGSDGHWVQCAGAHLPPCDTSALARVRELEREVRDLRSRLTIAEQTGREVEALRRSAACYRDIARIAFEGYHADYEARRAERAARLEADLRRIREAAGHAGRTRH